MTREKFFALVTSRGVYGIGFYKRDKTYRRMGARLGVTKYVTGVGKSYKDEDHNLVTVYDMNKRGYRSIKLDSITYIKHRGNYLYLEPQSTSKGK